MGNNEHNSNYWGSMSNSGTSNNAAQQQNYAVPSAEAPGQIQHQPVQNWQAGQANGYQQPYQAYQQPFPQNQQRAYTSGKDHIAAGLLAIFLGGLGIHKFYLGYNSVGFIMLGVTILGSIFTFGLAGLVMEVIGIVEGIIYLSKDQQSFDRMYVYNMKEWF